MASVFVSYSFKPASQREQVTSLIIAAIKEAIVNCGWSVIDPMVEMDPHLDGIKAKVERALHRSDAIIAEGTLLLPNVMYECGYMRAHRKPLLYLIDKDAYGDSEFAQYLKLIGINEHAKTASDFGDIEYIRYDGKRMLSDVAYRSEIQLELVEHLNNKFSPHMAQGRVLLNDSFRSMNRKLHRMIRTNTEELGTQSDYPFFAFLSGWVNQISSELQDRENIFRLDIDYYEQCLSSFTEGTRKDIYAIADLTDMAEPFWDQNPNPQNAAVAERIFLLDVEWCFDAVKMEYLFSMLQNQALQYRVRVGLRNQYVDLPHHGVFRNSTHGMNCLIIKPNTVGRYVTTIERRVNRKRIMLQFVFDKDQASHHLNDYDELAGQTMLFDSGQWVNHDAMVDALFRRYEIGKWKAGWNVPAQRRTSNYFDWYEGHIRSWIKEYDELVRVCRTSIAHIKSRSNRNEDFKVLELGFGSGRLTAALMEDPQISYTGIDPAVKRWQPMLQRRFGRQWPSIRDNFHRGTAWGDIPLKVMRSGPYDIICGSLVLHDFYEDEKEAKRAFENMLRYVKKSGLLKPNGSMVFADIFIGKNSPDRQALLTAWEEHMKRDGKFSPRDLQYFKENNSEMFDNLSEDEIRNIASPHGFDVSFSGVGWRGHNPFKVLVLHANEQ